MLRLTVERILPLISMEDVYAVINICYKESVIKQLPCVSKDNVICEPIGKNMAPCIGLGTAYILKKIPMRSCRYLQRTILLSRKRSSETSCKRQSQLQSREGRCHYRDNAQQAGDKLWIYISILKNQRWNRKWAGNWNYKRGVFFHACGIRWLWILVDNSLKSIVKENCRAK